MGFFDFLFGKRISDPFKKAKPVSARSEPEDLRQEDSGFMSFLRSLSRYYMDFLETDFHKRGRPRRSVSLNDDKSPLLKIGVNLEKYPDFFSLVGKSIQEAFSTDVIKVPKGKYRREMPSDLIDSLRRGIVSVLTQEKIDRICADGASSIARFSQEYTNEYDMAFQKSLDVLSGLLKSTIVVPLVRQVEKPLRTMGLGDENSVDVIQEDLTKILLDRVDDSTGAMIRQFIADESMDGVEPLSGALKLDEATSEVMSYFQGIRLAELYSEIFEIERCKHILENKEYYLYFCDISYEGVKYPIFYIPIDVESEKDRYELSFHSQVFINKKALEYIAQEYNRKCGTSGMLQSIKDRILYLSEGSEAFHRKCSAVLDELCDYFGIGQTLSFRPGVPESISSKQIHLSTSCYLVLFDKADEALVNDYEELLNMDPSNPLVQSFERITQSFITQEPENVNIQVDDEWNRTEIKDQLVFESPIPLNGEQRCVLSALEKSNVHVVTVEGPPGTGKSHTITAVLFNAVLQNRSVLVLSDKKEALDVVEDKISSTLNSVRLDQNFQNPILRLGKAINTYSDILSASSITQIENHFKVVRSEFEILDENIHKSVNSLKEDIETEILAYQDISLEDILEAIRLWRQINTTSCPVDLAEVTLVPDSADTLREIRGILMKLRSGVDYRTDCGLSLMTPIDADSIRKIGRVCDTLSTLIRVKEVMREYPRSEEHLKTFRDIPESQRIPATELLHQFYDQCKEIDGKLKSQRIGAIIRCDDALENEFDVFRNHLHRMALLRPPVMKVRSVFENAASILSHVEITDDFDINTLKDILEDYDRIRGWGLGFLFHRGKVAALNLRFKKAFSSFSFLKPHRHLPQLKTLFELAKYVVELKGDLEIHCFSDEELLRSVTEILKGNNQNELDAIAIWLEEFDTRRMEIHQNPIASDLAQDHFQSLSRTLLQADYMRLCSTIAEQQIPGIEHILDGSGDLPDRLYHADLRAIARALTRYKQMAETLLPFDAEVEFLREHLPHYPHTQAVAGMDVNRFHTVCENKLTEYSENDFDILIRYISLCRRIQKAFQSLPDTHYGIEMANIHRLVTALLAYKLDERVVRFKNESGSTAKTLRHIIQKKRKFPKDDFLKLKEAFPCILASVRDYAEYIPLIPEIFDLVIFDEASQVSIAQAFPALLRARRVLILGDNKQFSNLKAAQARTDINTEYMNRLEKTFRQCVTQDPSHLTRLQKFNIKTSVLDFAGYVTNYSIQLRKHFRGYKELISYSNHTFYNDSLQVMKIRGKPIREVIRFDVIPSEGKRSPIPKTNSMEVDFIIAQLREIRSLGKSVSLGIITPHTNQQEFLYQQIRRLPESQELFDTYKLKIMTFDTCQGEERDIVFYSMVASEEDDRLGFVFPKNLDQPDLEDESKIRIQRLNVGFSRARERMHFVLSKAIDTFSGTIRDALGHYFTVMNQAGTDCLPDTTDSRSPMEAQVLNWFYQTEFWEKHRPDSELFPQFNIGDYLSQLDPRYSYPKYRVDFLLAVTLRNAIHNIIIEYDGFEEHFKDADEVGIFHYQDYYRDEDVYRQKILEGYGYRFIRINRFNIGDDPVEALNQQLYHVIRERRDESPFLKKIRAKVSRLENGDMKECPKCKRIRSMAEFKDPSLLSGMGRICIHCKGIRIHEA